MNTVTEQTHNQHLIGTAVAAGSFAVYSVLDVFVKLLSAGHSIYQIMVVNALIASLMIAAYGAQIHGRKAAWKKLETLYPRRQLLRGFLATTSSFLAFSAYSLLPLANVYLVGFLGPFVIAIMMWVVYKERTPWQVWLAIAIGFAGTLVVLEPQTLPLDNKGTYFAFGWLLVSCVCVMLVRSMPRDDLLVFPIYTYGVMFLVMLVPAIEQWRWYTNAELFYTLGSAMASGIAGTMYFYAIRITTPVFVAPFQYTQILWGLLYGYFIWHTLPTDNFMLGGALIVASGLFLMFSTRRFKQKRSGIGASQRI